MSKEKTEVNQTEELWKPIDGFERYEVSNLGNVKNARGKIVNGTVAPSGHRRVSFRKDGKLINLHVSRLVAQAFIPNPENKERVYQIDGNKLNEAASNLVWKSIKEISQDEEFRKSVSERRKGTKASEETKNKMAKSHSKAVSNGEDIFFSINQAVKDTGVSHTAISNCLTGRTKSAGGFKWEYLEDSIKF